MNVQTLKVKISHTFETYERQIGAVTLLLGFILDGLTLRRPDLFVENAIFALYTIAAAICIILVHLKRESIYNRWFLLALQFFLGALFSMSLVFYYRAASFSASWPFLLLLTAYLIGNEIWRSKYTFLIAQASVFFTAIFSYFIFLFPIFLKSIEAWVFVLSGIGSLVVISLVLYIVRASNREEFEKSRIYLMRTIGGIFLLINILYFTRLIPPIPLFLKDVDIYHSIARSSGGEYAIKSEAQKFNIFRWYPVLHVMPGGGLYAWSSIYSPADFDLDVVHVWEYYDTKQRKWIQSFRINLSISGGREQGFRTYSKQSAIKEGLWRVSILTQDGRRIGREKFRVEYVDQAPSLVTETK